ncbi:hypothetical protein [Streptomyces sp. NPDC046332]|uniref:hypothetical protein n=1 Tax=unclassified Streptomyces TaxID=2593676 RepID=UPI0033D418F2
MRTASARDGSDARGPLRSGYEEPITIRDYADGQLLREYLLHRGSLVRTTMRTA